MKPPQESPDFPDAFYRVAAKGLCVRDGKLLLVKDFTPGEYADAGGLWELPGGGLNFGEECREALIREVREEMGLEATFVAQKPTYLWTCKRFNKRYLPWHYVLMLAFRFDVAHLEFNPSDECREMGFFSKEEIQSLPLSDQMQKLKEIFVPADFA